MMRRGIVVAIVSAVMAMSGMVAANATIVGWGGRDAGFTPPALNGPVNTIIQLKVGANAGKYLIGGSFTDAGGNSAIDYVARLNADGTIDTGFTPPVMAAGSATCTTLEGGNGPTIDVRTLLEVPATQSSPGRIMIGGNFTTNYGGNARNYLVRVGVNGGTTATGFVPSDTGTTAGTQTYTNCVRTMFTAEGSGGTLALVVGSAANGRLTKKVFDTGADYAGFTTPNLNAAVNTGFYCPAGTCGAAGDGNKYVIGGVFTNAGGATNMNRIAKFSTNGSVYTGGGYPTSDGTTSGTPLFVNRVNSVALDTTSSPAAILVGGTDGTVAPFTGKLSKLVASTFVEDSGFTAPNVNGNVWSVAVDSISDTNFGGYHYVFGGSFTDAGGYPACDYICFSDVDGNVVDSTDRSYFPAPPPGATVRTVFVSDYANANEGKYLIGGDFTNLGGNTATDYVARLNMSTPASITINSDGGNTAGGTDGIRTVYSNGQWQVYRGGDGQLYDDVDFPPSNYMYNQIALSLTAPGGGGYAIGPSSLELGNQNIDFTDGFLFRPWDSVTATGGSTGTGTGASALTVQVDGRTYTVNMSLDYTYPNNYIRQTFTVTIPAGNTYNVKLFNLYDSYLGGSDEGPGFYDPNGKLVGVSGSGVYEGLRYVSGQAWDGWASAFYYDVVFGNDNVAAAPTGPGYGTNLDQSIDTDPTTDNGFGINWDFGSTVGTTAPVVSDFIFADAASPTAAPTNTAGEVKVDWTVPAGMSPTDYIVTAYDSNGATAQTCTATAPALTCTVTGLDPAVGYRFLVNYRSSGSTIYNAGTLTDVHPKRAVPVHIWGDPTSVGPAITFSHTLGANPDSYMAGYTGLTSANQAVPTVTPACASGTITPADAVPGATDGEYTATVGCQDGATDIDSYQVKITVGAGSCLMAAGLPSPGTYNVGNGQQTIPTYGTNLPDGANTPAYQAVKDATPSHDFGATATAGVYLPATRACQPSAGPSTASTATVGGAIPTTVNDVVSNGGSARFMSGDLGNINGFNRILAQPSNATGAGGGYRNSYARCGVTNASGSNVNCQLGPPAGVRVTAGGLGGFWNPAGCAGQTIDFRSRYMTQMGYGLWSDPGSKLLAGGCS